MEVQTESLVLGILLGVLVGIPVGAALASLREGDRGMVYQKTEEGFLLTPI